MNSGDTYQYKESQNKIVIEFRDIFDIADLQRMQDQFSDATGVASIITLPDGSPLTQPSNFCPLCNLVRSTDKGLENCLKSDKYSSSRQNNLSGPIIYTCLSAGLWDSAAPIVVDGHHLANWLIGQVRNEDLIEEDILKYANEIGIPLQEYNDALQEVPTMSSEKFRKISETLLLFANEISQRAYSNYQLKIKNEILLKNEETIRLNELRYKGLIDNLNAGVMVYAPDTSVIFSNKRAAQILGLTNEKLNQSNLIDFNWLLTNEAGKPISHSEHPINIILANKEPIKDLIIGMQPDTDTTIWLNVNGFPVMTVNSEITEIVFSFDDITKRKNDRDKLTESEQFLKQTQLIVQLGTFTYDLISEQLNGSEIFNNILGLESDKYINNPTSIIHPDWQNSITKEINEHSIGVKKRFDQRYKIIRESDNSERWVHGVGELVYNEDGHPIKLIGAIRDITDQKLTEEILRMSEEKFRSIFENVHDIFYQINMDGIITEVSPSLKHISDFQRDEIIGKTASSLYDNQDDRNILMDILRTHGELNDYEINLKTKNGTIKHASINCRLIYNQEGKPERIDGAIRDITKRKKAELALKQNETFLRETQLIAKLGTFKFDCRSQELEKSDIFNSIFGIDNQSKIEFSTWKSIIHPDWESEVTDYFLWKIKESKKLFDIKFKILKINDRQERWIHTLGKLVYDNENSLINVFGTVKDITDSKTSKEALKESREQLKKFAAHLQNVREEERLLLAREIHDKLGQILIALKIDLGMLKQNVIKTIDKSNAESVLTKFDGVFQLVDNTIDTTRKIMSDLRSEVLFMLGFVEAARLQVKSFEELNNIDCYFNDFTENTQLTIEQSVALFRVLQESLSNVAQHSNSTLVKVRLETNQDMLLFEISDNGVGLHESAKNKPGTYGFIEMKERIQLIKGELQIESTKGNGTSIYVQIPINNYSQQQ